jgi:hypothetical protein
MDHHGSETYFIPGEGYLGESVGGRETASGFDSRTATAADAAAAAPFRFSRMGPRGTGKQLPDATLRKLGEAMIAGRGPSQVPAGFTYLGQFMDHDLTFDETVVTLGENISPAIMIQGRSPTLDLDSLYGAGPADPESEKFYEADGVHLKMGKTAAAGGFGVLDGFDLPRGAGSTAAQKRRAIIPDKRNDENLAVAQTHLAMIRFHNRVVDTLPASVPPSQRFRRAREKVTKHYQWMIRTDYLRRICAPGVVNSVFNGNNRKVFEVGAPPNSVPSMPIEFSVAAFRLGHSMIRGAYNWNKAFDNGTGTLDWLFIFSGLSGNLGGMQRLASNWVADFRRLYDFGEANRPNLEVPENKFNRAMRIDTRLVNPLATLPGFSDEDNLAIRNLQRAKMVKLATGQQMFRFMRNKGVNLSKLTDAQIRNGRNGADLSDLTQTQRAAVIRDTPLWFYILRESEFGGGKLKGVGARIVAETFHRAMQGARFSIVRDPGFRPSLGPNNNTFRMVDLLVFAFRGRKNLLAPLG